VTSF
jgi:hypothetical protein